MRLRISFPSLALLRPVDIVAALPDEIPRPAGKLCRTVWALHCAMSDAGFFFDRLDAASLVDEQKVAFIAPSLGNGWFINSPFERQADFLQEMFECLRDVLPLSRRREDNLALGVSMGAFGAVRWAMSSENFGGVAGISGVYDCTLPPDERLRTHRAQRALHAAFHKLMRQLLLDEAGHAREDANLAALAARSSCPRLALYCGDEDYLSLSQTRHLERLCREGGQSVTACITSGEHDAIYWKHALQDAVSDFFKQTS